MPTAQDTQGINTKNTGMHRAFRNTRGCAHEKPAHLQIHSGEATDICARARRGKFAALKGRQFTDGGERVKRALPPVNVGTHSVYRASSARPALAVVIDDACDHKCPPPAPSHGRGIFIITHLPGVTLRSPPAVNCRPFRAQKTACERGCICRAYARTSVRNPQWQSHGYMRPSTKCWEIPRAAGP